MCANKFYIDCPDIEMDSCNDAILITLDIENIQVISHRVNGIEYLFEFVEMAKVAFGQGQIPIVQVVCHSRS